MKNFLLASFILFTTIQLRAQDTITVQTLNFSDITKRQGWYVFPPDTGSYQKILMYYTLKCDPQTTQDNYDCGEWDYTTYTNLYDYNGMGNPYFKINGTAPDSIQYSTSPSYTVYESYQYFTVIDNTIFENVFSHGTGTANASSPLKSSNSAGRAQFLWTATELSATGLTAGTIQKLKLDFNSPGTSLNNLKIKMKNSALSTLSSSSYETTGFTDVYFLNTAFNAGLNEIIFTTPFNWDGTSAIVIEFSFTNDDSGTDHILNGEYSGFSSGIFANTSDPYLDFDTPDYVEAPAGNFASLDSFITVAFWQYGDPAIQPSDDYLFEGRDANGNRVINAHLPWSNGRVYWDAGNSGTSAYDRIDQAAAASDYEGQWNHWAFTKNVASGSMKIYLNGNLFFSGTGKTKTMSGITKFVIGGYAYNGGNGSYDGNINDFCVFDKELSQTTIQNWMYKNINASHPDYSNLLYYYTFDDFNGSAATEENGNTASLAGMPGWRQFNGDDIYRNIDTTAFRPNISFVQGSYSTHLDSVLVTDSVMNDPVSVIEYTPEIVMNVNGVSFTSVDTTIAWATGWSYTYDYLGNKTDSSYSSADTTLYNSFSATTVQLQNYVTPYGIGLDLGPNGFRWVYDVTDYEPWLHDTLDLSAGNQQELIDLKFVFITGTPPHEVLSAEVIWNGEWGHANIADDVVLPAVVKNTLPNGETFMVRTRTTGHDFGGFQNCAEFCPKHHRLFIDGSMEFEWLNWTSCAINPVISQGGTWIYDRAGWCPGKFADTYDHDITPYVTAGQPVSIDYGIEPYPAGGAPGVYRIAVQYFQYGPANFTLDAAIDDILSPNQWEFHNRYNPVCDNAKIRIKNTGTTTLTSLDIKYRCEGGFYKTYTWNGSLDFLDTATVVLPINDGIWWGTSNVFEVTIENPNGSADQYSENNTMKAQFDAPPMYSGDLIIWYMPNGFPTETTWYLKDGAGNIVESQTGVTAYTLIKDTVTLVPGCYSFEVYDNDDDGLSFFANSDGNGYVRLRNDQGIILQNFDSDFGRYIVHQFTVGYQILDVDEQKLTEMLFVYPNPGNGMFKADVEGFDGETIRFEVYNSVGQKIWSRSSANPHQFFTQEINLEGITKGVYFLRVSDGKSVKTSRIIVE